MSMVVLTQAVGKGQDDSALSWVAMRGSHIGRLVPLALIWVSVSRSRNM
jgi:hypothetical protein